MLLSWVTIAVSLLACHAEAPRQQLVFEAKRPPLSRRPESCPGYRIDSSKETVLGHHFRLALDESPCHAYGIDDRFLLVDVEYQTKERLRVHIRDEDESNVLVPEEALPLPKVPSTPPTANRLDFGYSEKPFAFWVIRKADGEIIFDTRNHTLIFEDQYLQLGSALPIDANIYGLGEVAASSGFKRDPNNTRQAMWDSDNGTPVDYNLYGAHAVYLEYRPQSGSHTVFLRNSHAMDILLRPGAIEYRALGGTLDFYLIDGPTPLKAIQNYVSLIGLPQMQPKWALGFHLLRWGYETLDDAKEVIEKMRAAKIPQDTLWFDIDYMRSYEDFTLDHQRFPPDQLAAFLDELHDNGQHFVPIVDLGIAIGDNEAYLSGLEKDVFVKNHDGSLFSGLVWPGYTVFPDFFAERTQDWWREAIYNFSRIVDFDGLWLDMNEASNFCTGDCKPPDWPQYNATAESDGLDYPPYWPNTIGQQGLMHKSIRPSAKHANGLLEYNVHNLMGIMECRATNKVMRELRPNKRPFLLSRSTYPSSGTVTSHWLGDNYSIFESLRLSIQGLLQFGIYGIPLIGPDVCGFGRNTTEELCARWMQFGSLAYPFMRNHNSINSLAQEPYQWESVAKISRDALSLRYALMPYIYTLLQEAASEGTPIIRALLWEFPDESELTIIEEQIMLGPAILVSPVLEEGVEHVMAYLPGHETWFGFLMDGVDVAPGWHNFSAPLDTLPLHVRAGSILLMHTKPGLTIKETEQSPYTLTIALDSEGKAMGKYYFDDGISFEGPSATIIFAAGDQCLGWQPNGDYIIKQRLESVKLISGRLAQQDSNFTLHTMVTDADLNKPFELCWG